jgi:hypothetical protein
MQGTKAPMKSKMEESMVDTIKELTDLSRRLNQKSDTLNEVISSINEKLAKLNIGVEAWLENSPIEPTDPHFNVEDQDEKWPLVDGTLLGYARVDDEYQLAIKEATLTEFDSKGLFHPDYYEITKSWNLRPLLKVNRNIRVRAMDFVPELLQIIKREATKLLNSIEKAEKAAADL